jgi:hypothetical protein
MTTTDLSAADRLTQVLDHLTIERAHFAASMLADVAGFAQAHPERIASLTLVCPPRLDSSLRTLGSRLQIIAGDQGRPATMVRDAVTKLPEATVVWLPGYFSPPWADPVADCTADVENALSTSSLEINRRRISQCTAALRVQLRALPTKSEGEGPPLALLPLSLRPLNGTRCWPGSARGVARLRLGVPSWVFWRCSNRVAVPRGILTR